MLFRSAISVDRDAAARSGCAFRSTCVGVVCLLLSAAPSPADERDVQLRLSLAAGADSNPLRMDGGEGAGFAELRFGGSVDIELGTRTRFFLDSGGTARLHRSAASGADAWGLDLESGFSFSGLRAGPTRMAVALGGFYERDRSTFTDRASGETYRVTADPPGAAAGTVAIPDRFDAETAGVLLEWRIVPRRRLRLSVEARAADTHYLRDYSATTTLEPLDYRALTIEPAVFYRVNDLVALQLSVALTDLDFERQPALDWTGGEVAGMPRRYSYRRYRARLRLSPAGDWRLMVGAGRADRSDLYAGYYDYAGWDGFVSVDRKIGRLNRVQGYAVVRDLDYDHATVPGDPDGETRGSHTQRIVGRYDREIESRVRWFVEAGAQRTDSRDALFSHDREWILTGLQFKR